MRGALKHSVLGQSLRRLALATAALALALPTAAPSVMAAEDHAPVTQLRQSGEQITQDIVGIHDLFERALGAERARLQGELRAAAIARYDLLAVLIKDHPEEVLRLALPDHVAATMPTDAQPWIEQPVEIDGEIEVLHVDFADGTGEFRYFLKTDIGERFSLHFVERPRGFASGTEVRASGLLLENVSADGSEDSDGAMAVASEELDVEVLALDGEVAAAPSSGLANTFGQQNTVIVLVNFQDKPTDKPWTTTTIDAMADGTLSNFFRENSSQQTWLNVDTFGWFTLPLSSTSCSYSSIDGSAATAATNAGVNLSSYSRRIYVFPYNAACGWSGLGTIGGNPSKSWINGISSFGVYAHEMGHNIGLYHSHGLDCGSVTLCSGGTNIEYGHFGDTMGNNVDGHFNSFQKERLGWLAYNASPTVSTAQASGTYTIKPYSAADSGPKALKILKSVDGSGRKTYYYIESRRAIGFDAPLGSISGGNFLSGVTVSIGTESSPDSSFLLDMTPTVGSDFRDAALAVNQNFTDGAAGVTITPLSASNTEATIDVNLGSTACVRANPTVSLTPDQSQWVPPGTAVTYNVAITNNDGSGCASSSFNLTASIPSGWTAAYGDAALNLAAGANGATTLQIASMVSAVDGFYDFTSTARNGGATTYSGADTATYVVSAAPPNNPPVAVNDSAKTSASSSVTINVLVNDSDPDGDPISITGVTQGGKGTATITNGQIIYTAGSRFRGSDTFTYTISDGQSSASATVTVSAQKRVRTTRITSRWR